jgi:flagellar basal-body rod modification protein FlgD
MLDVSSTSAGIAGLSTEASRAASSDLNDQFLELLVTQLKNQDPINPVNNEDFVAQLAQLQTLDQSIKLSEMTQSLLLQSTIATGASLIGKQVTGQTDVGGDLTEVTGELTSFKVVDGKVIYSVETEAGTTVEVAPERLLSVSPVAN